ncbi:Gfo/Idh/MocA family protein [Palleronia sp. KMU-117]|uniref:Gfo/Idh/MocA family protein n=1 Tax=Palleronia sp. KMU-117 TaxID=3434108 RepID=UPI003D71A1B4
MVGGLRIAVIGAGSIGTRHAGNLRTLGVDVLHIPWRDFRPEALNAGLDGVVIATATPIRRALIALCAERGLPFYAEKPLTWSPDEARAIAAAAAPVAERSMVGFMMRYHPALRDLAARDPSDIYGFSMEIGHDVRQWRANWRFADSYASQAEGGGVLLDLSHELDMACALFPGLAVTRCDALGHDGFPGVDMASFVQAAAPGGPVGRIAMDYLSPVSMRRTLLRGLDHHVEVDFLTPALTVVTPGAAETTTYTFERNDMFLGAMRDFLALVAGTQTSGNPLMPRFDRMSDSTAFIAAAWAARRFVGTVDFDLV